MSAMDLPPPRPIAQHVPTGPITVRSTNVAGLTVGLGARFESGADGALRVYRAPATKKGEWALVETVPAGAWSTRVDDTTTWRRKTPGWAIALAVVGALVFLLGLLFLLVKETVPSVSYTVTVQLADGRGIVGVSPVPV